MSEGATQYPFAAKEDSQLKDEPKVKAPDHSLLIFTTPFYLSWNIQSEVDK